ncbi:hypothetical protein [Terrihabitans sp. B22-R8]|uniref:hypothetical protein n=1 Tax=Terrihabitans sp. B22-R8 TaxID=3425128 RepID=UPI00403C2592
MNTANLQLEGLYAALAAMTNLLIEKGIVSQQELERCLIDAEETTATGQARELSNANVDAIRFPFRYLRAAIAPGEHPRSFAALAAQIGLRKDQ